MKFYIALLSLEADKFSKIQFLELQPGYFFINLIKCFEEYSSKAIVDNMTFVNEFKVLGFSTLIKSKLPLK